MTLTQMQALRLLNDVLLLEKRAGIEDAAVGLGRLLVRAPGMVARATRGLGTEVTHALVKDPTAPGRVARTVGGLVRYAPHMAGTYMGYRTLNPYVRSKYEQFKARQMQVQPYYDEISGRYQ